MVDGLKVKRAGKRGKGGSGSGGRTPDPRAALERPVVNCLACGKVYDARGTLTADVLAWIGTFVARRRRQDDVHALHGSLGRRSCESSLLCSRKVCSCMIPGFASRKSG